MAIKTGMVSVHERIEESVSVATRSKRCDVRDGGYFHRTEGGRSTVGHLFERTLYFENAAGNLVKNAASRFLSYTSMKRVIDTAVCSYKAGGYKGAQEITIDALETVGEGYAKNSNVLRTTTKAVIKFDKYGNIYTAYPVWK